MSDGSIPFTPKFDHLVYLRIFEGCNLRCEHCFIPSNPKKMDMEQVRQIPELVSKFAKKGSTILLQWHGGEPTLFGPEWMQEAIESVENNTDFVWRHGIQTNLLSYSQEWRDIYKKYFRSEVGVSWDPKIRIFNGGGPESNKEFESRFWVNFRHLLDDGLDPYLVVTGTKVFFETFKNPVDFFEMCRERGIRRAHIERLTETGYARINWDRIGVNNAEYSKYMARFARAYEAWNRNTIEQYGDRLLFLSPFDGLMETVEKLISGGEMGYGCWSGHCDTRFHTIDQNGYKRGCTAVTSEIDNKNANKKLILDLNHLPSEREKRQIYNCASCNFRPICSSGCLAIDFDDGSGECSGGYKFFAAMKDVVSMRR